MTYVAKDIFKEFRDDCEAVSHKINLLKLQALMGSSWIPIPESWERESHWPVLGQVIRLAMPTLVDGLKPGGYVQGVPREVGEGLTPPKRSVTHRFSEVEILSQDCFCPSSFCFFLPLLTWYLKKVTSFNLRFFFC